MYKKEEQKMQFVVYLAGEMQQLAGRVKNKQKLYRLHLLARWKIRQRSDNIGEEIMGLADLILFKRRRKASDINNFRTEVLMEKARFVITLFGEKYKQWNTAMDASYAIAKGNRSFLSAKHHPLKELSGKANITVKP